MNEVIDYTCTRFESVLSNIDLIFDTVGGETQERSYRVLRRGGRLISIAAPPSADKATGAGVAAIFFIVRPNRSQSMEIGELIDSGKLEAAVQSVYPLAKAKDAFVEVAGGHLRGKIALDVVS